MAGITNTLAFIDDIFDVTQGTEDEHIKKVKKVLKRLVEANICLKLEKFTSAADKFEWKPTNLKKLRSFLVVVNQYNKFIPNLAELCFQFRNIIKKGND